MSGPYDEIMDLPHHVSPVCQPVSLAERAAQFSPFAALTGYDAAIRETGRLTDQKIQLTEDQLARLDQKYRELTEQSDEETLACITYFEPDPYKDGGTYLTAVGTVRRTDSVQRLIYLTDGTVIPLEAVFDITTLNPVGEMGQSNGRADW